MRYVAAMALVAGSMFGAANGQDLPNDTNTIRKLTVAQARLLAHYSQDLRLNGMSRFSEYPADEYRVAKALGNHKGGLELDALKTLNAHAASCLASNDGWLSLDGISSMDGPTARALAKCNGGLSLDGLTVISDEVADALAAHRGGWLGLNGLTQISTIQAAMLASTSSKPKPSTLQLKGLKTLSPEAAKSLANYEGELFLDGVTVLSDKAAEALSEHKGKVHLLGLSELSDQAAAALRGNPEIQLPVRFY